MTGDKFQVCFVQARYKTNLCRILVSSNTSLRPSANSLLQTQTAEMRCEQPFALLQECPCASLPKVYIISFYQKPLSDLNSHLGASLLFTGGRRLKPEILSDLSAPTDSCTTLSLSLSFSFFLSLSLSRSSCLSGEICFPHATLSKAEIFHCGIASYIALSLTFCQCSQAA